MKTITCLLALLATAIAAAPVGTPKEDCCKEAPPPAGPISARSIYQLDAKFCADTGQCLPLATLRGRPVVLAMFFASCGYACPRLVTDMQAIRGRLPAELRDKAAFVLVSFDVERDTPGALADYRRQRALDGAWTLLHGDQDAVSELAALLGVKFRREPSGNFAHSNLIAILNAEGEVVHRREGLSGGLDEATQAVMAAATRK
ncbi:MAG: SCO family protein [Opitutaceae bacterium]|nr:SCO family protein [Opitutaceae bacterium]